MKINKNYTDSIQDNVLVSTPEGSPQEANWEPQWSRSILSWLSHSSIKWNNSEWENDTLSYLQYLDAKITAARKNLTAWDTFSIRGSAQNQEEFTQLYSQLPNNSSLVITHSIDSLGFTQGDIIVKDFYGQQIRVPATFSGFYQPTTITGDINKFLNFSYQQNITDTKEDIHIDLSELNNIPAPQTYNIILDNVTGICNYNIGGIDQLTPFYEVYDQQTNERVYGLIYLREEQNPISLASSWILTSNNQVLPFPCRIIIK